MKKFLSLLLAGLIVLGLVACGGSSTSKVEDSANKNLVDETTSTEASTSEKDSKQVLVMCTNAEFPPYEYKDNNEFKGIDVEISQLIAKKLNVEVKIEDIAFDSLLPEVNSGKADFAMAGMTVTEDRMENVDFTHTYQTAVQVVVVNADSSITDVDGLTGKTVGVQLGTTGDIYCSGSESGLNVERYNKIIDGFQAMKAGKVDACVIDDQVAKNIVSTDPTSYKILETKYAEEEYAIAVKKGNTELLNKLNTIIDEIKENGELKAIIDKYIK